jgi:hypothetical protein
MDRRLGGPLPHQQANPPRTHPRPEAEATFSHVPRRDVGPSGINPGFPGLFRCRGQVIHVLLTRSPLSPEPKLRFSLDLHVLGAPPAFVLSQDQTLREETGCLDEPGELVSPFELVNDALPKQIVAQKASVPIPPRWNEGDG